MIALTHLKAEDVPPELEERLLELTLPAGEMVKVYRSCRSVSSQVRRAWTGRVVVASIDGKVVGWALRWRLSIHGRKWIVHLFVDPEHRRDGVGTALVAGCRYRLRRDTELKGCPWDQVSREFWASIGAA